jgi:hypothetical protein
LSLPGKPLIWRRTSERLARLGVLAECCFFDDAPSALIKLRQFGAHRCSLVFRAQHAAIPKAKREAQNSSIMAQTPLGPESDGLRWQITST